MVGGMTLKLAGLVLVAVLGMTVYNAIASWGSENTIVGRATLHAQQTRTVLDAAKSGEGVAAPDSAVTPVEPTFTPYAGEGYIPISTPIIAWPSSVVVQPNGATEGGNEPGHYAGQLDSAVATKEALSRGAP